MARRTPTFGWEYIVSDDVLDNLVIADVVPPPPPRFCDGPRGGLYEATWLTFRAHPEPTAAQTRYTRRGTGRYLRPGSRLHDAAKRETDG